MSQKLLSKRYCIWISITVSIRYFKRQIYSQIGTLQGRPRQIAIIDVVDCMLIDDSSKIAKLATKVAGMDRLQTLYHFIWNRLNSMQYKIIEIDGTVYFLYGNISYGKIIYLQNLQIINRIFYKSLPTNPIRFISLYQETDYLFFQIKHQLKMTSETFTNFLSNMGFFKSYENLFGLTGTLGSQKIREELTKYTIWI